MNLSSIGKNIRKYRLQRNLCQEDLAEMAALSSNYIGMVERGEKVPWSIHLLIQPRAHGHDSFVNHQARSGFPSVPVLSFWSFIHTISPGTKTLERVDAVG